MFKRKEVKEAGIGDYVQMSPSKAELMVHGDGYKKSSYSWYSGHHNGDGKRREGIRNYSFQQNQSKNNRINFEDTEVLYYKGDSFFSKEVAEVIPIIFKNESYSIGAAKDFVRRNKSYFVNKKDLVILSPNRTKELIQQSSNWRCERALEIYVEKGVINQDFMFKVMGLINS